MAWGKIISHAPGYNEARARKTHGIGEGRKVAQSPSLCTFCVLLLQRSNMSFWVSSIFCHLHYLKDTTCAVLK